MTKKELLLKDLCARLPYGVKCRQFCLDSQICTLTCDLLKDVEKLEPYLRPMSSMTEEEIYEYNKLVELDRSNKELFNNLRIEYIQNHSEYKNMPFVPMYRHIDYLNTNHLDYRGLISMGLAIEASEGMYKTE